MYGSAIYGFKHSINSKSPYFDASSAKGYGAAVGFHLDKQFMIEANYEVYKFDGKLCPGMSVTYYYVLEEKVLGATLRAYFFKYLGLKAGLHKHTFSRRLFLQGSNDEVTNFSWDYTASLYAYSGGIGLRYPVEFFDFFADYTYRSYGKGRNGSTMAVGLRGYLP